MDDNAFTKRNQSLLSNGDYTPNYRHILETGSVSTESASILCGQLVGPVDHQHLCRHFASTQA